MDSQNAAAAAFGRFTGALCVVCQRCDGVCRVARVPHSVEGLPGLVNALIGVRSKEVPLCLQGMAEQGSSRSGGVLRCRSERPLHDHRRISRCLLIRRL